MIAFMDNLSKDPADNIAIYNQNEEIRSSETKNTLTLRANYFPITDSPKSSYTDLGLMIYPSGEMKISPNFRKVSTGHSGYIARITLRNKYNTQICQVVWVDNIGRAHNCPINVNSTQIPTYIKQICECASEKIPNNENYTNNPH